MPVIYWLLFCFLAHPCPLLSEPHLFSDLYMGLLSLTFRCMLLLSHGVQGQVLRVDVGMSAGCANAPAQVLEILHDNVLHTIDHTGTHPVRHSSTATPQRAAAV